MKSILFIFIAFGLLSCSQETSTFKFKDEGCIRIKVKIAGKEHDFLFDTGAATTVFSQELVEELGKQARIRGNDSVVKLKCAAADYARLAYKPYEKIPIKIGGIPLEATFVSKTGETSNIVGMNVISQLHWRFNLRDTTVTVSTKPILDSPKDSNRLEMNYITNQGAMTVPLHLNDSVCPFFLFDTGWGTTNPETRNSPKKLNIFELQINTSVGDPQGIVDRLGNIGGRNYVGTDSKGETFMILPRLKIENIPMDFITVRIFQDSAFKAEEAVGLWGDLTYAFVRGRFSHLLIDPQSRKLTLYSDGTEHLQHIVPVKEVYHRQMKKAYEEMGIPYEGK